MNRWRCERDKVVLFNDDAKNNEIDDETIATNDCRRELIAQEASLIVIAFRSFCALSDVNAKIILFLRKSLSLFFIFKDCFNCLLKLLITRLVIKLFRLSIYYFRIEIVKRIYEFMSLSSSFRRASTSMTKKT